MTKSASKTKAPATKKAAKPTVTKCPPAKAKGAKTTAEVPSPKRNPGATKKPAAKKAPTKKAPTKTTNGKGGTWALPDFANDDVITVLEKKPFEDGSVAASRFRLFKSGQTVGECLAAQKEAGFLRRRVAIRKAREAGFLRRRVAIRKAREAGYIKIGKAKGK